MTENTQKIPTVGIDQSNKIDASGLVRKHQIVVITSGWVAMGMVARIPNTDITHITDAYIIRSWGTTKGLGQIALEGPTDSTILDPHGVIECRDHAVIMSIDCVYNDKKK